MRTKQEVEAELREIEETEKIQSEDKIKQKNFERFMEREEDFMIGRAHADINYIGKTYQGDREKSLMPSTVHITGNCGESFQGKAPVTDSTRTYFRNIWNTNYTRYEEAFQNELNELTRKYVKIVCEDLPCVLEMMGLQADHYFVNKNFFPEDKVDTVKKELEKARAEILDKYPDEKFLSLIRKQTGWVNQDGEPVPEQNNVDLSHSRMILYRYIFKNRPTLKEKFSNTSFYEKWKDSIII